MLRGNREVTQVRGDLWIRVKVGMVIGEGSGATSRDSADFRTEPIGKERLIDTKKSPRKPIYERGGGSNAATTRAGGVCSSDRLTITASGDIRGGRLRGGYIKTRLRK